jgi:hypothetical protein
LEHLNKNWIGLQEISQETPILMRKNNLVGGFNPSEKYGSQLG